jgi:serine/threonine-protein kinase
MPKVGRYHIQRKIADGGMAEIFLGTQHGAEGFERPVVLKRILAPLVADPQFRNMLIDEAHVAMSLNHSNIVQVLDLGHSRDRYYLVMELVDGWDLNQILARTSIARFPLPPELGLYVAAEVCRALAYAHSRMRAGKHMGIVHRDISPQNILVSEQGEVKLADFGIAKAMGRREQTGQGVIKGKLAFMSPEQASGKDLDGRSDLFSLGSLLYVLFTGQRPFQAPTDLETVLRVRQCQFEPAEKICPLLDPSLTRIISRAMQATPEKRYQTADEILVDLERVQRAVYKPAGQTELKQWLADLSARDQSLPISRHAPFPVPPKITQELEILDGADVIFDESALHETLEDSHALAATVASTPPKVPSEIYPTVNEPVFRPFNPPPKRRWILWLFIIATPTVIGGFTWRFLLGSMQNSSAQSSSGSFVIAELKPSSDPAFEGISGVLPDAQPDMVARPDAIIATTDTVDGSRLKPLRTTVITPDAAPVLAKSEEDDEEEDLLKTADPADSNRILGEEEGVPIRKKKTENTAKPKRIEPLEPVSVHIATVPEGAVIKLGKRVFGRAPMNLRFRPGATYNLTFVKQGYVTKSSQLEVTGKQNQTFKATLKKRPEPRKSFFRRIFGG